MMPSIHIHIENNNMVSEHIWNPSVDVESLVVWWDSLTDEQIDSIRRNVNTLDGHVDQSANVDPDPRWCLFVSDDEAHFSLGDKYFMKGIGLCHHHMI